VFEHITPYSGDPILALVDGFVKDPRAHKVNLSIGIYFDEGGRLPLLPSVQEAQRRILAEGGAKPYLPMEGEATCRAQVAELLLGVQNPALVEGRVATIQTVGSSGGLKVGADFLRTWLPHSDVWVSDPTWDNHRSMFEGSGFQVHQYPYHDAATGGLRFADMLACLRGLPERSVVLLHACCHNPTGVDLSAAQWDALIPVLRERELLPYLDLAYQGFGDGLEDDAHSVRALAASGLTFFVANSFSKSMSVYGERCGALSAVCANKAEADLVMGQLRFTIRRIYSSPAIHSARIVAHVLGDADLRAQWEGELASMRQRLLEVRRALHERLCALRPDRDFGYLLSQRGMFSYTGLSTEQVDRLRDEHAVYLIRSGRLCVAGLTQANVDRVALALAQVV